MLHEDEEIDPEAEAGWLLLARLGILLDKTLTAPPPKAPAPQGTRSRFRRR